MRKEEILKFYQRYQMYIFPALVSLSALFLIIFAIYPQTAKLISNQATAADLTQKTKFLDQKVSALESIDEEDLSRKVSSALRVYPTAKDLSSIFGLLQQIVLQSGFTPSSMTVGGSNKVANSESFLVRLEVKGYRDLIPSLLNNLENSKRLIKIDRIDLSTQSSQIITVNLVVQVFYAQAPNTFGSTDSPLPEITDKEEALLVSLARYVPISETAETASSKGKSNPFE